MKKSLISYALASIILLLILLIPTFFGLYGWKFAIAITFGCIIADIIGRKFFLNKGSA